MQAAVQQKPEEPQSVGGFERASYQNPLGRRSVTAEAQVRSPEAVRVLAICVEKLQV